MQKYNLESIVDLLGRKYQRATYGAVADLLGVPAQSLMQGLPMSPRYSWIVNSKTLLPTDYPKDQIHPVLHARTNVLTDHGALGAWLTENE
jgi:hypothetical protein